MILPALFVSGMLAAQIYHSVPLETLKDVQWTHVAVCGKVTFVKVEGDGDVHVRLDWNKTFIVAEIVPYHKLPAPKVGQYIIAKGISRLDKEHRWYEVHPVESITVVEACQ